jgi:hypothetical protein
MQVQVFAIPMDGDAEALEALNRFLRSQKVLSLDKVAVVDGGRPHWSSCVEYLPRRSGDALPAPAHRLADQQPAEGRSAASACWAALSASC